MRTDVDLRELAIDRGSPGRHRRRTGRQVLSRYVLPLLLVGGFFILLAWAARDLMFPPTAVTVVPVFSTTSEVRQEGTPLFQAAGWIEPRPTPVRVAALAAGVVEELLVVEDQPVQVGDAIAELVKDDARLAYERSKADLELRQAEVDEAQAALTAAETRFEQPVHLEAALAEAEASLAKIDTQLKNLPFEARRAKADEESLRKDYQGKLAAKDVVAGVAIDIAKGKADSAKALVEELGDRLESLRKEQTALTQRRDALKTQLELLADETKARDGAKARVRAAAARVAQAEVILAEANLRLERMTVRAPTAGRVYQLIADPGTNLAGGSGLMENSDGSTVVTLYRPDMLQVRVDVRFEDIPKVSLNQPVEIDNPALSSPLTGQVLFVSSEADIQKNTLEVKVAIPDPPPLFKPAMLVDVTFLAPKRPEQDEEPSQELKLYVPQELVLQDESGQFVWLADQSAGIARQTRIETGTAGSSGLVEVTSGLTVASRIIAGGSEGLDDGERIRVAGESQELKVSQESRVESQRTPLPTGD